MKAILFLVSFITVNISFVASYISSVGEKVTIVDDGQICSPEKLTLQKKVNEKALFGLDRKTTLDHFVKGQTLDFEPGYLASSMNARPVKVQIKGTEKVSMKATSFREMVAGNNVDAF